MIHHRRRDLLFAILVMLWSISFAADGGVISSNGRSTNYEVECQLSEGSTLTLRPVHLWSRSVDTGYSQQQVVLLQHFADGRVRVLLDQLSCRLPIRSDESPIENLCYALSSGGSQARTTLESFVREGFAYFLIDLAGDGATENRLWFRVETSACGITHQ